MKSVLRLFNILFLVWGLLVFFVIMVMVLPFILISFLIFKGKKATDFAFGFLNVWGFSLNSLMGYRYRIINKEVVDKERPYIFVVNHSSYLDSVAIVRVIPQSFKPLGKIEMVKIPIFGIIYKKLVVLIDRSSKESREASVAKLKEEIKNGQSILIFPEGTMNRGDQLLGDFYDGAFRIAIETQTPILPLTLINTKELMPRNHPTHIKPGIITCVFSKPFEVDGLQADDLASLKSKIYQEMEQQLIHYKSIC
ncbi:1-acyl-sn-glycerol-3-phosphate acyltransferase [Pelobium sp.]|nr:lysophospholipid acyltransferase family protein [Pelobium sp.]MDA9555497.1 1-acyl-sn-glycerol-3-phosphate acyltransferase [Pelobium sp.]